MSFLATLGDAIGKHVAPIIDRQLTELRTEALDMARDELREFRTEALTTLRQALPEMSAEMTEATLRTVFKHTQIDESADRVLGAFNGIIDRLPIIGGMKR